MFGQITDFVFNRESDSRIANVRPSVPKPPQSLRIMPISQISAYLSLLAIMPAPVGILRSSSLKKTQS